MFSCFKRTTTEVDDDVYHARSTSQTVVIYHEPSSTQKQLSKKQLKENQKQLEKWQKEYLMAHNKYRAKHGVQPLKLSKKLNIFALEWANHMANNNLVKYREDIKYGENIAHCFGLSFQPESCVKKWYDEITNYNYQRAEFNSNSCHFTQVIWRDSKKLGVGVAVKDNSIFIVCNYDPAGNQPEQYKDCVPRSLEDNVSSTAQKSKPVKPQPVPSSSKSTSRDTKNWSEFELDCLDSHNTFRSMHGCPELKLNRKICNHATEWSKVLAKRSSLQHRPNNVYGENLFYCSNYDPTAEHCIKSFYDEIQAYNFSKPGFSSQTGHFTAVVWKDTTEMGVGKTKIGNQTFVVCNYSPAGNISNCYKEQVPPPLRGSKLAASKKVPKKPENTSKKPDNTSKKQDNTSKKTENTQPKFEQVSLENYSNHDDRQQESSQVIVKKSVKSGSNWTQVQTTQISYTVRKTNI